MAFFLELLILSKFSSFLDFFHTILPGISFFPISGRRQNLFRVSLSQPIFPCRNKFSSTRTDFLSPTSGSPSAMCSFVSKYPPRRSRTMRFCSWRESQFSRLQSSRITTVSVLSVASTMRRLVHFATETPEPSHPTKLRIVDSTENKNNNAQTLSLNSVVDDLIDV